MQNQHVNPLSRGTMGGGASVMLETGIECFAILKMSVVPSESCRQQNFVLHASEKYSRFQNEKKLHFETCHKTFFLITLINDLNTFKTMKCLLLLTEGYKIAR